MSNFKKLFSDGSLLLKYLTNFRGDLIGVFGLSLRGYLKRLGREYTRIYLFFNCRPDFILEIESSAELRVLLISQ